MPSKPYTLSSLKTLLTTVYHTNNKYIFKLHLTRDISGTIHHGHVYKNIHWIIFVTTSNSAFKRRKQIYMHEIKIQKYHYFDQCIQRFAYHTNNHNYDEYKFVYYINANAAATTTTTTNNNNKVTGIVQLNTFSCTNKQDKIPKCARKP